MTKTRSTNKRFSSSMIIKALIIVVAAFLIGMVQNHEMMLYPSKFKENQRKEKLERRDVIALEDALSAFESGQYVFVDARSEEDYLLGHIPGAVLLPPEDFDVYYPAFAKLELTDRGIIVYCQDIDCDLADRLKNRLEKEGFTGIQIFAEGWYGWAGFGFPVE